MVKFVDGPQFADSSCGGAWRTGGVPVVVAGQRTFEMP